MINEKALEIYQDYKGCWIVASHSRARGYPQFARNGKRKLIHRYMYEKYYGNIPVGILVCHKCDTKACVNPNHLFLGTHRDNAIDALKKGRLAIGENHPDAKLSEQQVREIRIAEGTNKDIGIKYKVSETIVSFIRNKKRWKHLA